MKLKIVSLVAAIALALAISSVAKADSCTEGLFSGGSTITFSNTNSPTFTATIQVECSIVGGNTVLDVSWLSGSLTPVGLDKFYWISDSGGLAPTSSGNISGAFTDPPGNGTESADGFGTFTEGVENGGNKTWTGLVFTFTGSSIDFTQFATHTRFGPCSGWESTEPSVNSSGVNCPGTQVPEASSLALLGAGLLGMAGFGFVRRKLMA